YERCSALLVEANHDIDMLAGGPYPLSLKRRVASAWGHLNNMQTVSLLQQLILDDVQHLVVGHISRTNNSIECVQQEMQALQCEHLNIHYACQDEGFDWLHILAREDAVTDSSLNFNY